MSEKEKASQGEWYNANYDQELITERIVAKDLCFHYNQTLPSDSSKKNELLNKLFLSVPNELELLAPFYCDYGYNIKLKENIFINHNCYFMDCATISIGNYVFIGPNCGFYTASHPIDISKRNQGLEKALPIIIEDNVWIGANVTILPGITVGKNSIIAAGSLLTKDVPENSIAIGSPAKVKTLEKNDYKENI